jgi:hypothetical protein
MDGILGHNLLLSQAFSVGIPSWMGFLGHNILLSRAFSVGIPSWMGFLGHNLLLSWAFFHNVVFFSGWNTGYQEAFFMKSSFFHDGILAIMKPFSRTFYFFKMEFWLSGSLSHELFFHDGILAIRKPFSRTFFFFSRWNSGYQEAFLTNSFLFSRWNSGYQEAFLTNFFLFFHDGFLAIRKPFSQTFSFFTMEFSKYAIWGKTLYIYISQRVFTQDPPH